MRTSITICYKCDECGKPEAVSSEKPCRSSTIYKLPYNWTLDGELRHLCWDCSAVLDRPEKVIVNERGKI